MFLPTLLTDRIYIELPKYRVEYATDVRSIQMAIKDANTDGREWKEGYYQEDAHMSLPMENGGQALVKRK